MIEWVHLPGLAPYAQTLAAMEDRVAAIAAGTAPEAIWLLEHPPLYTAGTSARAADLTDPARFPVHIAGRGGQYTYHGPGQRVAYVMLDLNKRGRDVRQFVCALENWIIATLAEFNVKGERRAGSVEVELGWPMSADYLALKDVAQPLADRLSHVEPALIEQSPFCQYVYTPRPVLRPSQPAATISLSSGAGRYLLSLYSAM